MIFRESPIRTKTDSSPVFSTKFTISARFFSINSSSESRVKNKKAPTPARIRRKAAIHLFLMGMIRPADAPDGKLPSNVESKRGCKSGYLQDFRVQATPALTEAPRPHSANVSHTNAGSCVEKYRAANQRAPDTVLIFAESSADKASRPSD